MLTERQIAKLCAFVENSETDFAKAESLWNQLGRQDRMRVFNQIGEKAKKEFKPDLASSEYKMAWEHNLRLVKKEGLVGKEAIEAVKKATAEDCTLGYADKIDLAFEVASVADRWDSARDYAIEGLNPGSFYARGNQSKIELADEDKFTAEFIRLAGAKVK